ncbi:MAG TPA: GNAT family N-acetyltransferase [Solirubrobacteraceae bacterium]|nr:GNAT family N-acetyltransferase [Solirubrobacteraceae bacterium]
MAHGEVYAREFGWDSSFEALVAEIVVRYAAGDDPDRDRAWIAELAGRRVGCIFCVADPGSDGTALLRILFVHPDARGRDLGRRLIDTCLEFARTAGYERVRLWTNHPLLAARHLYLERGFQLVAEEPHHSFGVDLVGQTYELELVTQPETGDDAGAAPSPVRSAHGRGPAQTRGGETAAPGPPRS